VTGRWSSSLSHLAFVGCCLHNNETQEYHQCLHASITRGAFRAPPGQELFLNSGPTRSGPLIEVDRAIPSTHVDGYVTGEAGRQPVWSLPSEQDTGQSVPPSPAGMQDLPFEIVAGAWQQMPIIEIQRHSEHRMPRGANWYMWSGLRPPVCCCVVAEAYFLVVLTHAGSHSSLQEDPDDGCVGGSIKLLDCAPLENGGDTRARLSCDTRAAWQLNDGAREEARCWRESRLWWPSARRASMRHAGSGKSWRLLMGRRGFQIVVCSDHQLPGKIVTENG
jgi:hypothetical protein